MRRVSSAKSFVYSYQFQPSLRVNRDKHSPRTLTAKTRTTIYTRPPHTFFLEPPPPAVHPMKKTVSLASPHHPASCFIPIALDSLYRQSAGPVVTEPRRERTARSHLHDQRDGDRAFAFSGAPSRFTPGERTGSQPKASQLVSLNNTSTSSPFLTSWWCFDDLTAAP